MKSPIQLHSMKISFLINNFKKIAYLFVFFGYSLSHSGSYEDFFKAIQLDDSGSVASLLARGFDGNTRDSKGQPGLYLAVREKSLKVCDTLIAWRKIDVEARNAADESPLMIASLNGLTEVAQKLIAKGADVNKTGWTPLHYAATKGHLQLITLLLDTYAYIDAGSPNGTTPLMMAAFYGTPAAVKVLLDAGADPSIKNDQGLTAVDFAQRNSRQDSADLIASFVRGKQPKGTW